MRIVIVGSITFFDAMQDIRRTFKACGHYVITPAYVPEEHDGETLSVEKKRAVMLDYFDHIRACDAVLVYNREKHGIPGYIGANTLIEMAVAFAEHKRIYLWEPLGDISAKEEVAAMMPVVLNSNLTQFAALSS